MLLAIASCAGHNMDIWQTIMGHIRDDPVEVLHSDISRAYFNAVCHEDVFVRIPDEDYEANPGLGAR